MKTINFFRSKLLALTLALMASVSSFAYDEMPDFQVDGLYYNFLEGDNVEVTHPYRLEMPTEGTSTTATQDLYDDYAELTELTIPSTISYEGKVYNVIRIGYAAFDQCNLTYVDIPSSIKTIGVGAFSNCTSLTSITLKEGLEHIEGNAFADCRLLETITFPNSLKTVGSYAFSFTAWYNNQPNGGVYAGNVFYKYKGDIPENTSFVIKEGTVSISPDAFIKENRRIDYGLVAVAIPNSVEIIGKYAFSQCRALRSVNIPSRVTTIESYAFSYCKSLTSVTSEIVEPLSLPSDVFFKASVANATLYVPAESVEAYKNADQWKDFGQILPIEPTSYKSQWCNTWNVMWFDGMRFDETASTSQYRLGKDTIIGDYTYSKFTSRTSVRFTSDRKVYVYYEGFDDNDPYTPDLPTGEYLAYDFSAQVGDTLEVFSGIGTYSTYPCVVDDVQIDAETYLRTITLHKICRKDVDEDGVLEEYDDMEMTWIEGVGSPNGFLISDPPCGLVGGGTFALLCAYKGDELKYTGSLYDEYGCEYNATEQNPKDLFPTLTGLQRTEVKVHTTGADAPHIVSFDEYTHYVPYNKQRIYLTNDGLTFLREENNQVLFYAPSYGIKEDVVLYDWTLEVGDTLPYNKYTLLKEADFIVTNVSTITLLDGKEYKKWTLACGIEYIEGIGAINGGGYGNYFCLQCSESPAIYIENRLVCASRNGQLLYQMDDAEMERLGAECLCDYDRGPRKDNAKDGQIGGRPTPTQWNQLEVVLRQMDNNHTTLQAETFSYTLEDISQQVNNKTYFQLARQSTKDTATTKSVVGALHFGKDEDNRVYFLRDGVEYVLYDFTAEIGDTVEIFAGINNYPQETTYTHVVVDKDTTEDGACRMFLEVVFPEETTTAENAEKVWLAGLGSVDGIVHNAAKRTSNAHAAPSRSASSETESSVMLCAWREDSCLYTTDHPDYDTFGCVYNQDPTSVKDIHSSQSSYQKLLRDGQLFIIHDGKTYNVLGVPVE